MTAPSDGDPASARRRAVRRREASPTAQRLRAFSVTTIREGPARSSITKLDQNSPGSLSNSVRGLIIQLGARLIAVSPQLPDGSLSTAEKNRLEFDVLSDVGNGVARSFGLVYSLPEELREALRSNGKDLTRINGDNSWELPVPATFVIAPDRRVMLAHVDVDYRRRLAPEDIIAALMSLQSISASVK